MAAMGDVVPDQDPSPFRPIQEEIRGPALDGAGDGIWPGWSGAAASDQGQ